MPILALTSYSSASWWLTPSLHTPPSFFFPLPPAFLYPSFCFVISLSPSVNSASPLPTFPGVSSLGGGILGGVVDDVLIPHTLQTGRALKLYAVADDDSDPSLGDKQCWEWEWERDRKRTKARGFITFESCISNGRLNIMFKNVFILMHHTELARVEQISKQHTKGLL